MSDDVQSGRRITRSLIPARTVPPFGNDADEAEWYSTHDTYHVPTYPVIDPEDSGIAPGFGFVAVRLFRKEIEEMERRARSLDMDVSTYARLLINRHLFDEPARRSFDWPGDWKSRGILPPDTSYNEAVRLFEAGQAAVFVCGPEPMMDAVVAALAARGFPPERVRLERFASSIPRHEHQVARPVADGRTRTEVTVVVDGARKSYTLDRTKESLLDGALANGIELPYSCKGGVCATCRCRLVEGEVDMDVNFALEDYEVARGFVLACQSFPATDKVVVDFDQTGTG